MNCNISTKEEPMDIAAHPLIGDTISHAKEEILASIAHGRIPESKNWYAITTTHEENTLFYILSAREFRNPMYHEFGGSLKLIGLAGSRKEAREIVVSIVAEFVDSDSLHEIKSSLGNY